MKGFIIAHGRSGTTWIAHALRECCGLDARHESMGHELGAGFDGVESNGNLWRDVPLIRERLPRAATIHQVRDGRKVIRTVLHQKSDRTVERACRTWVGRNERLMRDIPSVYRFRLEDLTTDFHQFNRLARLVGADIVHRDRWEEERTKPKNASTGFTVPPFEEWDQRDQDTFWDICGDMMEEVGYAHNG